MQPRDCVFTGTENTSQESTMIHFSELCYKAFELGITPGELKEQVDICTEIDLEGIQKELGE